MSLPNAYSLKTASIPLYFTALLDADIPDTFDVAFMTRIGFRYAIDRSFIDILKELHFLSDNGMPTKRYIDFTSGRRHRPPSSAASTKPIRHCSTRFPSRHRSDHEVIEALKQLYAGKKSDMMITASPTRFSPCAAMPRKGISRPPRPIPCTTPGSRRPWATMGLPSPPRAHRIAGGRRVARGPRPGIRSGPRGRPGRRADPGQAPAAVADREPSAPVEAVPLVLELETEPASPVAARPLDALAPEAADARP